MTKLFKVTVNENGRKVTHLEKTSKEAAKMVMTSDVLTIEPHTYSLEDKLSHCNKWGCE